MGAVEGGAESLKARFVQPLGEARYGRESGLVGELNLLARTGLPVPEGVVLTRDAHQEFMESSGLLQGIQTAADRSEYAARQRAIEVQLRYRSAPIEGELNRVICTALIELGASVVVVLSEDLTKSGLKSIPEVRSAVRDAWLSLEGLERQILALACGEDLPTWPVLMQRELHPVYSGWSTAGKLTGEDPGVERSGERNLAPYDISNKSIDHLTLEAEYLLGEPVQIKWGLESGRWYILSVNLLS